MIGLLGELPRVGVGQRWLFTCGCVLRWSVAPSPWFETRCSEHAQQFAARAAVAVMSMPQLQN